jgi:ABC-type sugar transport system ATPase subunit
VATIRLENVSRIFRTLDPRLHTLRRDPTGTVTHFTYTETLHPEGPVVALDHVHLTIPDGKTVAVVGPSGCGKSTLLRVIAGLESFTGDVFYDEENMHDIPPKERYIGMVFQNYALYPHFEGEDNLRFFFKVHKAPSAEADERIRVTSEIMGIGFKELLKHMPGKLSGGQRQRVAIGRALVRRPRLFLFDEPLSNLDAKLRTQTRAEIKRLLHLFNITAVYVTHDQLEAIAIGDLIAVMRAGRIEQIGTYRELLDAPETAFVAGFFGLPPMNLLDGTVNGTMLGLDGLRLALPESIAVHVHDGQAVTLGIRPEEVAVGTTDEVPGVNHRFDGVVDVIEPDFGRHRKVVYMHNGAINFCVIAPLEMSLAPGDPLAVGLPTDALHFFDARSGARIRV